ncbi:TRAP transporter substrate-binding protein [Oceanibacterium hippocampi]|uniref:Sialic acid-binding periplasmic protein SiaP n=1 Tax=Oceanibacterium hippocampi TaxID=745714 RepID=A0A1Y5TL92_9PROT|nr:TRAP transporter substrate-binding protein [Oceanibacterium hippocampi]SLN64655.1 Sialic acid-binding periplasmic protein SiaP precursor [Oceanibacterium hippocampi]
MIAKLGLRLLQSALILSTLAAVPVHAADPVPIRVANPAADDDPIGIAAAKFAERVKELAGDAVQVRVFSRSVLGNENVALEATMAGNIDVDIVSNSVLRGVVPELAVLDVPYGLSSPEHAWRVLDGDIGKSLAESVQSKGLRLAGWAYAGSRCMMTRDKAVSSPDDVAGMKLRVPNNPTYANIAKAWGAIPTTVGWPETYLALSQGVVDAIETAPGPSFDQKHYEVAKNLIRTDHLIYFHIWVISEQSWKSWPEAVQKAVFTAAQEAAMYNRGLRLEQEKGVYDEFAAKGVTVIVPDREKFAARLKDVQASVADELKPMLARIQAVK